MNKKGNNFAAKKVTDAEKVDFYSNWNITAPYAKPLATSQSEWSSVLGYFTVLKYEKMVEYDCKNLKKYGLDSPTSAITVDFYQPKDGYTPTATATPNAMASGSSSSSSSEDDSSASEDESSSLSSSRTASREAPTVLARSSTASSWECV